MTRKSFKEFVLIKEGGEDDPNVGGSVSKDWKKEFISLEKGFIPPSKMRPIIEAFAESGEIAIMKDTSKDVTMPKKPLFLTGGSVRDFLKGKAVKQFHLATPATPEQIAHILHAAGFRMDVDRSGKTGKDMKLTFTPKIAKPKDAKKWFVLARDNSDKVNVVSIGAEVEGETFEISTFRKNPKLSKGSPGADFVDNPIDDASGRDININALYIELSKPDGENNKMYDPTGKGYHDIKNGSVRMVGKAEERFKEDPIRVLRAVRFHCRFGKGSRLDLDIERSLPRFKSLEGVDMEEITAEFLKGLLHPDTDVKCYVNIFKRTGLLEKVFPDVEISTDIPPQFSARRDKPLALAWLLKDNPSESVDAVLSPKKVTDGGEEKSTGWSHQDKKAVLFLLKLLEFTPQQRPEALRQWKGTGLSRDQIRDWVDMFKFTDSQGRVRNRRPTWAQSVLLFADNDKPLSKWDDVVEAGMHGCPGCGGGGCPFCGGKGEMPEHGRGPLLDTFEIQKFMDLFSKAMKE